MYFLILRPLSPKAGYHFFEGGGGGGGGGGMGGGGQKLSLRRFQAVPKHIANTTTASRMVTQPTQIFRSAVQIMIGRLLLAAAAAAAPNSPDRGWNRRPKRLPIAALPFGHCLIWGKTSPHCLGPHLPLTKNATCVFLSD